MVDLEKWEMLDDAGSDGDMKVKSHRLRVPGGYLIRTIVATYQGPAVAQTFVPRTVSNG